eukprot:CAMPEP_0178923764 /NCGR_PEP_ID=MMETSP0786-20121207/16935_1 /TAXON_ID=186022 /ORGANISM="Thalassionema frauenfeldii, Strain CCMP 1798" /LENGTH=153 /DNA_ID=CAMNT_0020598365 /DNA_START=267 /DNA_END=728 /DNA_ORIENTATION=+
MLGVELAPSLGMELETMLGAELRSSLGTEDDTMLGVELASSLGMELETMLGAALRSSLGTEDDAILGVELGYSLGLEVGSGDFDSVGIKLGFAERLSQKSDKYANSLMAGSEQAPSSKNPRSFQSGRPLRAVSVSSNWHLYGLLISSVGAVSL